MQHSKRDNTWSKWGIFLGVAVALGALVVVGWTFMQNRFQPGSSLDADVTIGIDDMPQSLDIRSDSSAAAERLLVDNVYETLVTVDQDNKLQPGLATSWKTSDDGLTVTLTLQSGVTFSNGHTLDASDAVWSLQQNVTNKVADVDELGDLASVANPNATTVVITLAKPNPTLLRALSGRLGIVYDSESSSADYQRKAIGSGPFTVADFQPGHSLKLARSDTYHGTKAASNVVEFMQYSDADALSKALTDGSLDMAAPVSASTATGLNGKDGLTVKEGATTDKVLLAYNNGTDSLLSDEQARKAFRYQIAAAGIASNMASTRAPQRPLAQLVDVVSGESHSITSAQVTIGRERSVSDIALRDPNVSRRHAQLTFTGSDWSIEDLNSTNGTLVNNRRITRCPLRNGDLLTFGLSTFEFRG